MIEFVEFGEHKMNKNKQPEIIEALLKCTSEESYYCWLNMIYNNEHHFYNNSYAYDTWQFLREVSQIANSPNDKLIVMGGIHSDTGHTSGLVLHQINNKSQPYGAFVSDSYIRFSIKLKSPRKLSVLNESQIFHFLTNVPSVLWTPHKSGNILLYNIPQNFDYQNAEMYYPIVSTGFKIKRM